MQLTAMRLSDIVSLKNGWLWFGINDSYAIKQIMQLPV